ncbi:hypothetical protein JB92DRAFT_3142228 [Gautieria morchelliformis]|nr:hypothetical protein JB92DRAFT_3142228 [Gautieria morchelliformis]
MFNNSYIISTLDAEVHYPVPKPRRCIVDRPCLPARLPSTAFMQREGTQSAPKAILRQLRRSPSPPSDQRMSEERMPEESRSPRPRARTLSRSSVGSTGTSGTKVGDTSPTTTTSKWREPQPFEIFRAVERKDIVFLMEVRDRAFHLLLQRTGDATPLLHAMRIGRSHRDVAILLVGALSRFVNHLEDEDLQKPRTKTLLKALRVNLKLAIDYGLQQSQGDLIASFMQCLIMSEGDKWVWAQTSTVVLALRAGTDGKPVQAAEQAVRKFATKELGKATAIAALEDYVANATVDLLLLATWMSALNFIDAEPIPSYYFARDDRVYKAFADRVQANRSAISRSLTKRLKWQIRVLERVVEGRRMTYRSKMDILAVELDEGEGI